MRIATRVQALEQRIGEPQRRVEACRRAARLILDSLPLMDAADGIPHEPITDEDSARIHDAVRRAQRLPPLGTPS